MKKKFLPGFIISALCLFLVLRNVDFTLLVKSLVTVRYSYLLVTLFFIFVFTFFRALRWKYLLDPLKKIGIGNLFELVMIGYLANNILPARMGEFIRAAILGETEGISKISSFATIVMERIFDVITLLIILVFASQYLPLMQNRYQVPLLAFITFGFLFLLLFLVKYQKEKFFKTFSKVCEPISPKMSHWVQKSANSFIEGLKVLEQGKHLMAICLLSGVIGVSLGGIYYFVAVAFDIPLTIPGLLFLLSIIFLGTMLPSSPGFIGTFHYFCIQGLLLIGVKDKSLALSYAIVAHLIQYIPESLMGIFFCWRKGFSFRQIQTVRAQIE